MKKMFLRFEKLLNRCKCRQILNPTMGAIKTFVVRTGSVQPGIKSSHGNGFSDEQYVTGWGANSSKLRNFFDIPKSDTSSVE